MKICAYCEHPNEAEDARCLRCGRRITTSGPTLIPEAFGNAAPNLDLHASPENSAPPESAPRPRVPTQGRLFPVQEPRKVLPFDRVSPQASDAGKKVIEKNARARALRRASERMGLPENILPGAKLGQQVFSFPAKDKEPPREEPSRYTNFPVAEPLHRLHAAALDGLCLLFAFALFAAVHHFGGASWHWQPANYFLYGALGLSLVLLFYLLHAVTNCDTPGLRWTGLCLVDVEGRRPTVKHRIIRIIGAVISIASLGVGLLWCLVEREKLTWHDEISNTIPTPRKRA
ncbi:MAG: RDD family protein [Bryobacter sp.]|nr:RDD family protein [Bryobacter sp.]